MQFDFGGNCLLHIRNYPRGENYFKKLTPLGTLNCSHMSSGDNHLVTGDENCHRWKLPDEWKTKIVLGGISCWILD